VTLHLCGPNGYELSTEPARLDLDRIHGWLAGDAYWALGRARDVVERSAAGSITYGVFHPRGHQVAVARAVTDRTTFAWLCDVYVDRDERGTGVGTWLVGGVRDHLISLGVYRMLLATRDAHGLYAQLGFGPLAAPEQWMELDTRRATR
jgi:GNAT superfamily N-acetyltransferase